MARTSAYKNGIGRRNALLETDYSAGMQFSNGPIPEGYVKTLVNYDYNEDKTCLIPRAGLRTTEFVFPDMDTVITDEAEFLDESVCIKAMRECIEDGKTYTQCILGKQSDTSAERGLIWVATFYKKDNQDLENEFHIDGEDIEIALNSSINAPHSHECVYYSTELQEIHGLRLQDDARIGFPVGTFAFGNSYYFMGVDHDAQQNELFNLYKTEWYVPDHGMPYYRFVQVDVRPVTASEAVLYGYNMLSRTPYTFENTIGTATIKLEGILPYDSEDSDADLVMTPKTNQPLNFRCYYSAPENSTYVFTWEWRTTDDDVWTPITTETVEVAVDKPSSIIFMPPAKNIMIRVQAQQEEAEEVEQAMVVGFDFGIDSTDLKNNISQVNYELGHCTGMTTWKNRLVLWGLKEDPTILFLSDMNEPGYFPYPNDITIFEDPIISALEFMDKLVVFTTSRCFTVEMSSDGVLTSTVIQSNLHITRWDRHLIQAVRNMLYFKSGNYYYMLVPKAQSTTGELTLAPISNPVTEFFNHFMKNVEQVFIDTYGADHELDSVYELISYYNILDYEDVHNIYVFSWNKADTLIHFDVMYNTVSRCWKINIIEHANLLFIYRYDATQRGVYATTTPMTINTDGVLATKRVVQLSQYDPLHLRDFYVPKSLIISRGITSADGVQVSGTNLIFPDGNTYVTGTDITIDPLLVDVMTTDFTRQNLGLLGFYSFADGFRINDLAVGIQTVFDNYADYFKFRNYQFLDTGYRTDEIHANKRYRELQLQINNIDAKDLNFGTEFYIDGDIRESVYKYEVTQNIDEMDGNYATAYVEPLVFLDIPVDSIDYSNLWTIYHDLQPEISLWKVRMQVSGKGTAPRLKLASRNETRYQLLGLNWVYRMMHMR